MNSEKIQESQRRESFKSPTSGFQGFEGTLSSGDSMAKKSLRSKRGPAPLCRVYQENLTTKEKHHVYRGWGGGNLGSRCPCVIPGVYQDYPAGTWPLSFPDVPGTTRDAGRGWSSDQEQIQVWAPFCPKKRREEQAATT